jgi:putative phosphoribosyl transferase
MGYSISVSVCVNPLSSISAPPIPPIPPIQKLSVRPTLHGGEWWTWTFEDRRQAGHRLAQALPPQPAFTITVGLSRGGIPVAAEVARVLRTPLDLCAVRKIGAPMNPELALGAVASGGIRVFNSDLVTALVVDEAELEAATQIQETELRKVEAQCRAQCPALDLQNRPVLLVDDGVATGATLRAAAASVRARGANRVTIATPTAPAQVLPELRTVADAVVVLITPEPFLGVGGSYRDFPQISSEEVARILETARHSEAGFAENPTTPEVP